MNMPAPGWYEDPVAAGGPLRWWDGTQWTEHTAAVGGTAQPRAGECVPGHTGPGPRPVPRPRGHPARSRGPADARGCAAA